MGVVTAPRRIRADRGVASVWTRAARPCLPEGTRAGGRASIGRAPPEGQPQAVIGKTLKNYVVEDLLGKGGMGAVYRARDTDLERNVAIKVLAPELASQPELQRRFLQEAKAASAVNHPAIAQIYEIEHEGDLTFIVMEYVDGSTVRQLVSRGELDVLSAVEIGIQVADAVARAHGAGIVHRDLKSDNIMVTRDGHPKVLDFGLAKLQTVASADADATQALSLHMTQAGTVLGTIAYMSPEQARGQKVDHRTDVFSLGVVLYEMSTGKLPFTGPSAFDTMHAIVFAESPPLTTVRAGLPYGLQRVVERCLRKDPQERYQNLSETAADLKRVKREIESGVESGPPMLERVRLPKTLLPKNLSTRGAVVIGFWGIVLTSLLLTVLANKGGFAGAMPFLVMGVIVYGHVRGRRRRMAKRFIKKAAKLKEVQVVGMEGDEFIVASRGTKASTHVKLNSLLEAANGGLYYGHAFKMTVRSDVPAEELQSMPSRLSVHFVREE